MKTTLQQRLAYKEARRFSKLRNLAEKLRIKCETSERSLKLVDEALAKCTYEGSFAEYLSAIRRAN